MWVQSDDVVLVPSGRYWLGDPSHALDTHIWDLFVNSFLLPVGKVRDRDVLAFITEDGDGDYASTLGLVAVDSGYVGLVPDEVVGGDRVGVFPVEFKRPKLCTSERGMLKFGTYVVCRHRLL